MTEHFRSLGIDERYVDILTNNGITEPTPVQLKCIPLLLEGEDVIAQAQTGTGKTLAFLLPIMMRIREDVPAVQALILTPTRELALQITAEAKKLAEPGGIGVLAAYGGQDVERQIRKLESGTGSQIVIATPGRLLDHMRRETIGFSKLSVLVLDEADQMLHMGFLNEVAQIIENTPTRRQTMLFSATMPQQVRQLASQYMRSPAEVTIRSNRVTLDEIHQIVVETSDRAKQDALCTMIDEMNPYLGIVFCRTKRRAVTLHNELAEKGYAVDELHGDLTQAKREQVMKRFRDAKVQLLIATDIAARGLDIEGVTHIFNYDIPHDVESYIHRIGRTGRAGHTGMAVTFASPRDQFFVQLIERGIGTSLEKRRADGKQTAAANPIGGKTGRSSGAGKAGGRPNRAAGAGRAGGRPDRAAGAGRAGGRPDRAAGAGRAGGRPDRAADAGRAGGRPDRAADAGRAGGRPDRAANAGRTGGRPERAAGAGRVGGRPGRDADAAVVGGKRGSVAGVEKAGGLRRAAKVGKFANGEREDWSGKGGNDRQQEWSSKGTSERAERSADPGRKGRSGKAPTSGRADKSRRLTDKEDYGKKKAAARGKSSGEARAGSNTRGVRITSGSERDSFGRDTSGTIRGGRSGAGSSAAKPDTSRYKTERSSFGEKQKSTRRNDPSGRGSSNAKQGSTGSPNRSKGRRSR